jgi:hypothetical protein
MVNEKVYVPFVERVVDSWEKELHNMEINV